MPNPLVEYLSQLIISAVSKASHSQPRLKNGSINSLEPEKKNTHTHTHTPTHTRKHSKKKKKLSKFMAKYTLLFCTETQSSILVNVM